MSHDPIRILLIDDDEDEFVLTREMLSEIEGTRHELDWVPYYDDGLRAIAERRHDIYVVDYNLGTHTGLDLVRQARANGAQAPFVILTGQKDRRIDLEAMRLGAADYLVKGHIDSWQLERSIRYALERHRLEQELRALSLVDELTGLYNRRGFFTLARQQMRTAKRMNKGVHVLFIDVDNLKTINDTLGHSVGDQVLVESADLLQETFRESDIVARYGGDEFVVLAIGADDEECEEPPLDRLEANIEARNAQPDRLYPLSLSIGVVRCTPEDAQALDTLLAQADERMYRQKLRKRGPDPPPPLDPPPHP